MSIQCYNINIYSIHCSFTSFTEHSNYRKKINMKFSATNAFEIYFLQNVTILLFMPLYIYVTLFTVWTWQKLENWDARIHIIMRINILLFFKKSRLGLSHIQNIPIIWKKKSTATGVSKNKNLHVKETECSW